MDALTNIRSKIKSCGLKTASVVEGCRALDRNGDGRLHFDDVEMIMTKMLAKRGLELTRREWRQIMSNLSNSPERGDVLYEKLYEVLDVTRNGVSEEMWYDRGSVETLRLSVPSASSPLRTHVQSSTLSPSRHRKNLTGPPGSIGEWLDKRGYPSEVANFKKFIHALEKYERDSGVKIEATDNGFVVPLGPGQDGLRVNISYSI